MLPSRAHDGDAGLDLYAAEPAHLGPGERWSVGTGRRGRDPRRARRPGPAAVGAGARARDRAGQQPRADRLRLPRRDPGAAPQHRSGRGLSRRAGDRIAQLLVTPIAAPSRSRPRRWPSRPVATAASAPAGADTAVAELSLLLYLAYLLLAFGLRTAIQLRRDRLERIPRPWRSFRVGGVAGRRPLRRRVADGRRRSAARASSTCSSRSPASTPISLDALGVILAVAGIGLTFYAQLRDGRLLADRRSIPGSEPSCVTSGPFGAGPKPDLQRDDPAPRSGWRCWSQASSRWPASPRWWCALELQVRVRRGAPSAAHPRRALLALRRPASGASSPRSAACGERR